jgi:hypothetical protein
MGARRVLRLALASGFCLAAWPQSGWESYFLPSAVGLHGIVADSNDAPLGGVTIHYLEDDGNPRAPLDIGADGRFEVTTRAPAVVFRKPGFDSEYRRTSENARLRIVMRKATRPMAACAAQAGCVGVGRLCLPNLPGFHFKKPVDGIDVWVRSITAGGLAHRAAELTWRVGPSWLGMPRAEQVWASVEYSESQKQVDGLSIADVHGKRANGKPWRSLGLDYERSSGGSDPYHIGESVSYQNVDAATAAVFDRMIDGVCVKPAPKE